MKKQNLMRKFNTLKPLKKTRKRTTLKPVISQLKKTDSVSKDDILRICLLIALLWSLDSSFKFS